MAIIWNSAAIEGKTRELSEYLNRLASGDCGGRPPILDGMFAGVVTPLARLCERMQEQHDANARLSEASAGVSTRAKSESDKLLAALRQMSAKHAEGWIDDRIPESELSGDYAAAAGIVNELVASHIAVKMRVVEVVKAYAGGDYSVEMDRLPGKKAQITEAIDQVRAVLKRDAEARIDMERIKSAVENVTANVMIADGTDTICYMNKAVIDMMRNAEKDLQRDLPNLRVDKLIGTKMDEFHKNPAHQRRMVAELRGTYRTEIVVAGRTFALIANPIVDEHGTRLGAVVEWIDRTLEVAAQRETADIVEGAARGDFTRRLPVEGRVGFFKQLAEHINSLMETADRGLNDVVRVLAALAKGDLRETITGDYQGIFGRLKDDANATVGSLSELVTQIKSTAEQVNTAAREIAEGNTNLSQRTEEQASGLEETASSMEEFTATVKQNSESAQEANKLGDGAQESARKSGAVVSDVVQTMDNINASSQKIVEIISVIDGIAFQTNILALNAAVEAARAGEQGRGFAVVAGEVRSLAQRSAAAAKEIKDLINDTVSKVSDGSQLVGQAGTTMTELVDSVQRVTAILSDIAAASREQSSGIDQVNKAIAQMDEVTQQNSALVEQAAAAAGSLEEQARILVEAVSTFKLDASASKMEAAHVPHGPTVKSQPVKASLAKAASRKREPVGAATAHSNGHANGKSAHADDEWETF